MAEPRSNAVVVGELKEAGVENGVAALVFAQPDRPDSVVENLFRHATEVLEGSRTAAEEIGQSPGSLRSQRAPPVTSAPGGVSNLTRRLLLG